MGTAIKAKVQELVEAKGWTFYRLSKESGVSLTALFGISWKGWIKWNNSNRP